MWIRYISTDLVKIWYSGYILGANSKVEAMFYIRWRYQAEIGLFYISTE